jgi:hypothetical protein
MLVIVLRTEVANNVLIHRVIQAALRNDSVASSPT